MKKKLSVTLLVIFISSGLFAQNSPLDNISGDLQLDFQYYQKKDTSRNILPPPEKMGMNAWMNVVYTQNYFSAGIRYEAFQNALLGYDSKLNNQGIPYRFFKFQKDKLTVTAGNYYAQFGNGLLLRAYEERGLGIDNSLDGIKLEYKLFDKIYLTALTGKQRYYFTMDASIIRGVDGEINVSDFFQRDSIRKFFWKVGVSYVNRFYPSAVNDSAFETLVEAYSFRSGITYQKFNVEGEFARKSGDPLKYLQDPFYFVGNMNDTTGYAYYVNASFHHKGIGISAQYKKVVQFDFRANPTAKGTEYLLNFLPPIAKQQSLKLFTRYPFVTQGISEQGVQGEIIFSPKRGKSFLLNYSMIYDVSWKELFYESVYADGDIKVSKSLKSLFAYQYLVYNKRIQLKKGMIYAHILMNDWQYRWSRKYSIRAEIQYLLTEQDLDDWLYGLAEFTVAPHFSVAVMDEYNVGNTVSSERFHYINLSVSYLASSTKFILSYGKQREGLICVGGVCRQVPSYGGIGFSVISNF